jgi:hypothetical protein
MLTRVATPIPSVPLGLLRVSLRCSRGLCNALGVTVADIAYLQFSIIFLPCLLQHEPNSREMAFSIIEVGSFEVN